MNKITLIGNLCNDVDLKYLPGSGKASGSFRLAVKRKYAKEGEQQSDFIYIQVWGKTAENCANYLSKGSKVAVFGELRIDDYTQNGENKHFTKINAMDIEFLDTKKNNNTDFKPEFTPAFEPTEDEDIPF